MSTNRNFPKINDNTILYSSVVHQKSHTSIAKGDSGASQHYITPTDQLYLHSQCKSTGPPVLLPNNNTINTTVQGTLPIASSLSTKAQTAHVLPKLHTLLISLGQLSDDNCTIILTKHNLNVLKNCRCILQGTKNTVDGLWDIPLKTSSYPTIPKTNIIIPKQQNLTTMLQYLHMCLFSPTKQTLLQAIKNSNLPTWPTLTYANVFEHLTEGSATALGHLD